VCSGVDVTDGHYSSEATDLLTSLQSSLPLIIDIAGDAIIAADQQQHIVIFNRAAELAFGYSTSEVIGQPLDILLPKRFVDVHHHHIADFIASPVTARYMHERSKIYCLRKDGSEFPAEASISKLDHEGGTLLLVILRDITEREQAEAELRAALVKQKEVNELKSRFISVVSHELRTPLAIIQSSNELLERYADRMSLERKQECFQQITEQVGQLSDLIEDTLMVTKVDTVGLRFSPQQDNLQSFCSGIVNQFELTTNGTHQLIFVADNVAGDVWFDKKLVWQALNNLLSNAIKYSPMGSVIYIDLICNAEQAQIRVKDEGIGIPDKDKPHIFENFHRGANVGHISGTGLGLVIARQAILAHGGSLTFESQEGAGTTFAITIPLTHPDS
jgi:PAS domain S-box-containing protein